MKEYVIRIQAESSLDLTTNEGFELALHSKSLAALFTEFVGDRLPDTEEKVRITVVIRPKN